MKGEAEELFEREGECSPWMPSVLHGGGVSTNPEGSNRMSTDMARGGEFQAEGTPGRGHSRQRLQGCRFGRQAESPGSLDGVQRRQWGVKDAELGVQRESRPR